MDPIGAHIHQPTIKLLLAYSAAYSIPRLEYCDIDASLHKHLGAAQTCETRAYDADSDCFCTSFACPTSNSWPRFVRRLEVL